MAIKAEVAAISLKNSSDCQYFKEKANNIFRNQAHITNRSGRIILQRLKMCYEI